MNITLPPELSQFVENKIITGYHTSIDDVVIHALRNLQERERLLTQMDLNPGFVSYAGNKQSIEKLEYDGDISALLFIVMMQAAKDMENDLKTMMEEMKSQLEAKKKLRELISKVNKDISGNAAAAYNKNTRLKFAKEGLGSVDAYRRLPIPIPDVGTKGGVQFVETDILGADIVAVDQLAIIKEELNNRLDSMSELSEMASLRLQMLMERRSKLMSTLSNIMKKISSTAESIAQNLK